MDAQLVRNVLILSTLVQVEEDWVRMGGWEQFVLPDAPRSTVEGFVAGPFEAQALPYHEDKGDVHIRAEGEVEDGEGDGEGDGECEVEEDEEEDVVFVMGREAGSWSPERPT
jgi:la-related protein 1